MADVHIVLAEYGWVSARQVGDLAFRELRAFDQRRLRLGLTEVFRWRRSDRLTAKHFVGVVQTPHATVEILPKVSSGDPFVAGHEGPNPMRARLARGNLTYMLAMAKKVRVAVDGAAELAPVDARLSDQLASAWAADVLRQLRLGLDRAYREVEELAPYARGRLLIHRQIRRGPGSHHLLWSARDDFGVDSDIHRILLAAARRLLGDARHASARRLLTRIVETLDGVVEVNARALRAPIHTRANRRFEDCVSIGLQIVRDRVGEPRRGEGVGYAMVFSMHHLFEEFVAASLQRNARALGLERHDIHPQGRGRRRHLLHATDGSRAFTLKPDVYIDARGPLPATIVDTKWKVLAPDDLDGRNGVSRADVYQMAAYAVRYGTTNNILLYPHTSGVTPTRYGIPGTEVELRVETLRLDYPLGRHRDFLVADLATALGMNHGAMASM